MKIGIHHSHSGFSERWLEYCEAHAIPYKIVDCYKSDIITQLSDCDALMWHHYHTNPKAILFARQLLIALEHSGKKTFPDFKSGWHFNDKLGQKYLLEAIGAPLVPSYIFYEKREALNWIESASFPKVFKLRGGAGSANVRLIRSPSEAKSVVSKAFGRGFKNYDTFTSLKEAKRKYDLGKATLKDLARGLAYILYPPRFSKIMGLEQGYAYFQDFIPGNDHDIRIIVIDDKAFAIKRLVRDMDFRASGSGLILYEKQLFDENTIKLSFEIAERLGGHSIAFDFVYDKGKPMLLEISYGFVKEVYDPCTGYWDTSLIWHSGKFNPYGWMVESLLRRVNEQ